MKLLPSHPICKKNGCVSLNHFVCPAECELLKDPPPGEPVPQQLTEELEIECRNVHSYI